MIDCCEMLMLWIYFDENLLVWLEYILLFMLGSALRFAEIGFEGFSYNDEDRNRRLKINEVKFLIVSYEMRKILIYITLMYVIISSFMNCYDFSCISAARLCNFICIWKKSSITSQHHENHMLSNVRIYLSIRYNYIFNLSIQIKFDSLFLFKVIRFKIIISIITS